MPPAATNPNHPVRLLRQALEMSRAEFADLIGTSAETIVSIENSRLALSTKLARRISEITGANLRQLTETRVDRLLDNRQRAYRRAQFEALQDAYTQPPADFVRQLAQRIGTRARSKLAAAARRNRLAIAYCDILEAVDNA